jgi:hypothetical protein
VLVGNVCCKRNAADHPCRQSPLLHVSGRNGERSADEEIQGADEKRQANPGLMKR